MEILQAIRAGSNKEEDDLKKESKKEENKSDDDVQWKKIEKTEKIAATPESVEKEGGKSENNTGNKR
jgi:hypothetical protein